VAAARKTRTGRIGFIGAADLPPIWAFQAGYVDGARTARPGISVDTRYLGGQGISGFEDWHAAADVTRDMIADGVDIIFNVAANAGLGIYRTVAETSGDGRRGPFVWVIGSDTDHYRTVDLLPGVLDADAWRPHILTSAVKRYDLQVREALEQIAAGHFSPGPRSLGLEAGGVEISWAGGFIDDFRSEIDQYATEIAGGTRRVPCLPEDRVFVYQGVANEVGLPLEEVIEAVCPGSRPPG
jgi:basic membrane protein A